MALNYCATRYISIKVDVRIKIVDETSYCILFKNQLGIHLTIGSFLSSNSKFSLKFTFF